MPGEQKTLGAPSLLVSYTSMLSDRAWHTEQAALRLIKSRARKYVLQAKAKSTDGVAYTRMLELEEAIEEEAARDWEAILRTWPPKEALAIGPIIEKMAVTAYREVRVTACEWGGVASTKLAEWFEHKFDAGRMLQ